MNNDEKYAKKYAEKKPVLAWEREARFFVEFFRNMLENVKQRYHIANTFLNMFENVKQRLKTRECQAKMSHSKHICLQG